MLNQTRARVAKLTPLFHSKSEWFDIPTGWSKNGARMEQEWSKNGARMGSVGTHPDVDQAEDLDAPIPPHSRWIDRDNEAAAGGFHQPLAVISSNLIQSGDLDPFSNFHLGGKSRNEIK